MPLLLAGAQVRRDRWSIIFELLIVSIAAVIIFTLKIAGYELVSTLLFVAFLLGYFWYLAGQKDEPITFYEVVATNRLPSSS